MKIVLIGSSTGGPNQLKFLLKDLYIENSCVVIAQHMSHSFIPSFVRQFNQEAKSEVLLAADKEKLEIGKIYILPKNSVLQGSTNISLHYSDESTIFNPNVNLLFTSAVNVAKTNEVIAILLTGMGDDGAQGLFDLYKSGVKCFCENEEDSVVYGMPKRAKEINPKLEQISLFSIKNEIIKFATNSQE
ncbi:chemotaxis protein CheB [uncultured Campylobacter sp.]|uniref:CheB methylesterase domain-containing protein n=1 Tax=uncultured Campylobacter sp. TaxID=218934 RepID=UPI00262E47CC|nr:chemotaxis protein CheB [uncultured Campylobacter sp.]